MSNGSEPRRHLDLEASYNIRDVGGYATSDGRTTRWKTLLRSDSLANLTPASQAALIEYGVRTVIDLRDANELRQEPDVFASSTEIEYCHQNMLGEPPVPDIADAPNPADRPKQLIANYTSILDRRRSKVSQILATLASPGTLPALVHCHGGKDRTGIVTALALALVGVPAATIAEDYALSARYLLQRSLDGRAPSSEAHYTSKEDFRREVCPPEAMLGTLQYLDERYGSVQRYVLDGALTREHIDSLRGAMVE